MKIDPAGQASKPIREALDHRARHAIVADHSANASTRAHSFDAATRLSKPITTPPHQGRPLCSRAPVCLRRPTTFDAKQVSHSIRSARRRGGQSAFVIQYAPAAANLSGQKS